MYFNCAQHESIDFNIEKFQREHLIFWKSSILVKSINLIKFKYKSIKGKKNPKRSTTWEFYNS